MNYLIVCKDRVYSQPLPLNEAQDRLKALEPIYPTAKLVETELDALPKGFQFTAPPEEVEDVGCAGGACTL